MILVHALCWLLSSHAVLDARCHACCLTFVEGPLFAMTLTFELSPRSKGLALLIPDPNNLYSLRLP